MTEEEEYRREVLLISLEKDNKRLLEIYRRGEEKDTLSQRAYENVYERVSYALSSSSLMDLEKLPDLEERIIFFFDEYYYDNVPSSSKRYKVLYNSLQEIHSYSQKRGGDRREEGKGVVLSSFKLAVDHLAIRGCHRLVEGSYIE